MTTQRKKRPDVLIPQFSRVITRDRNNVHLARQWKNKGWLEFIPGTPTLIRREIAVQVLSAWRRSCTPREFAELIGATRSWVRHAVDDHKIATVQVLVFRRIPRSEETKAKALWEESQRDVMFPGRKGWARYSPAKRLELALKAREAAVALGRTGGIRTPEAREAASKLWKRLHREGRIPYMSSAQARRIGKKGGQVAQAKNRAHRFTDEDRYRGHCSKRASKERHQAAVGTRRLMTLEQAGRILGKSARELEASLEFRQFVVDGQVFLYAHQVKTMHRKWAGANR